MSRGQLRVAIDVQHLYKPKGTDRGSKFLLPDGTYRWESELVTLWAAACRGYLERAGALVLTNRPPVFVGSYAQRNAAAGAWGAHVYLACHVNAGRGSYALCEYVAGTAGFNLGTAILHELFKEPGILSVKNSPLHAGERGLVCIAKVPQPPCVASLVEPFFGDSPRHAEFMRADGLHRIGEAVARGVLRWATLNP